MSRNERMSPYDQAVEYLSRVEYIDGMINEKKDVISSLRSRLTGTGMKLNSDRVQTSPKDQLSEICAKVLDLEQQLNRDIDHFVDLKAEVIQVIDSYIDNLKVRRMIYLRYLKYLSIETCARELKVSKRTAYEFHRKGVHMISRKFQGM